MKQEKSNNDDESARDVLEKYIPLWKLTDLDVTVHRWYLVLFRLLQCLILTKNSFHPDGAWQSTEVAYDMVYGGVDLPWEWWKTYALRSTLYPYLLAVPIYVLKTLGLDSSYLVRMSPFFIQFLLVCISDSFFWQIGKKTVGVSSARLALIFYLSNRLYNQIIIRCFSNGIEAILTIIAYHYFLQVKNKLTKSVCMLTGLITISFLIRNTSPVGWIPLLFFKVLREQSFLPFLLALFLVGFPVIGLSILLDTLYYQQGKVTITALNFFNINLVEGLSRYFGVDPMHQYLVVFLPSIFTVLIPFLYFAYYLYFSETRKKKQTPYIFYYCAFYLLVFSVIPHKENRFLAPILPFSFLMLGYFFFRKAKTYPRLAAFVIVLSVIVDQIIIGVYHTTHFKGHEIIEDLKLKDPNIDSVYSLQKFDVAYYSWAHSNTGNQPTLYLGNKNPTFARSLQGYTIPVLRDYDFNTCLELLDNIKNHNFSPKYMIIQDFQCANEFYCFQVCQEGIEKLDLYDMVDIYYSELEMDPSIKYKLFYMHPRYLYKLRTANESNQEP